jgi:hypothetical protein
MRFADKYQTDWSGTRLARRIEQTEEVSERDRVLLETGHRVLYDSASTFVHGSAAAINYVRGLLFDEDSGHVIGQVLLKGRLGDWHYTPYIVAPRFLTMALRRHAALTGGDYSASVEKYEDSRNETMQQVYGNDRAQWTFWE